MGTVARLSFQSFAVALVSQGVIPNLTRPGPNRFLNSPVTSSALSELKTLGWCDAQEKSPDTDPRATWRDFPERDASGVYRGVEPEKAKNMMWLDHVFYSPETVKPLKFSLDRTQEALDVSDHSPVVFDFKLR